MYEAKTKVSNKKMGAFALVVILIISNIMLTDASASLFTPEEMDYIAASEVIKVGTTAGAAPLTYEDENGEHQGIFRSILDRVSEITGFTFETEVYDSVDEIQNSGVELVIGVSSKYAWDGIVLSQTFLKAGTILYMNSSVKADQLDDKVYAAISGSALPEGIRPENARFYKTREASISAVEKGEADYSYGNAFSVAYYLLMNGYKNILTVPIGVESREYCFGIQKDDKLMLSIINKALNEIDEDQVQTLVLNIASNVPRKITLSTILDEYRVEITVATLIAITTLLAIVLCIIYVSLKLREQNKRYEALSKISNEYLYEYLIKKRELKLSSKFQDLFFTQESKDQIIAELKNCLRKGSIGWTNDIIRVTLPGGEDGIFKTVNTRTYDSRGRVVSIIGKIADVRDEVAEKEELLLKSQIDGLTGLFNATTTKYMVSKAIEKKEDHFLDALVIIDCDDFKKVNDKYGHLIGSQVLEYIASTMKTNFRNTDIIGRIGGDEFCIYLRNVFSAEFVKEKCQKVINLIKEIDNVENVSVSMGVTMVSENEPYEVIFDKADKALYEAKCNGKGQVAFSSK